MKKINRTVLALVAVPLSLAAVSCSKPAAAETVVTVYNSPT